ncbi:hypothetical protein [Streptomyces sp. NPDC058157]|uniref:hypothetical protein n=1 Tax=Streptomyces sp. NPDC058157 TaxID=3346360 RepID=UPI0036EC3EA7
MSQSFPIPLAASDTTSIILALFVPVVTGAIGAIGLMLRDRRENRNIDLRRKQKLERAQLKIHVLTAWADASQKIGPSRRTGRSIEDLLDECLDEIEEAAHMHMIQPEAGILRRVFLFIHLKGRNAHFFRTCYLVMPLVVTVVAVYAIPSWSYTPAIGRIDAKAVVVTVMFFVVLIVLFGALLRRAALRADERARHLPPPMWPSPGPGAGGRLPNDTPPGVDE